MEVADGDQQKLVNAGELKLERVEKFKELLEMGEKYKRVNRVTCITTWD